MNPELSENLDTRPTALVVENDAHGRRLVVEVLSAMGFRTLAASSASEALERCKDSPAIDLVITDLVLPGMNGIAFARRMRNQFPGIKVVFTSGYTAFAAKEFGFELDGPLLEKPLMIPALRKQVANVLSSTHVPSTN